MRAGAVLIRTSLLTIRTLWCVLLPVCTENLIRVDAVMESPKLAE
jgi:hypothetical protein